MIGSQRCSRPIPLPYHGMHRSLYPGLPPSTPASLPLPLPPSLYPCLALPLPLASLPLPLPRSLYPCLAFSTPASVPLPLPRSLYPCLVKEGHITQYLLVLWLPHWLYGLRITELSTRKKYSPTRDSFLHRVNCGWCTCWTVICSRYIRQYLYRIAFGLVSARWLLAQGGYLRAC